MFEHFLPFQLEIITLTLSRVVAVDSCFTLLGTLQCGTTSREALLQNSHTLRFRALTLNSNSTESHHIISRVLCTISYAEFSVSTQCLFLLVRSFIDPTFCGILVCGHLQLNVNLILSHPEAEYFIMRASITIQYNTITLFKEGSAITYNSFLTYGPQKINKLINKFRKLVKNKFINIYIYIHKRDNI